MCYSFNCLYILCSDDLSFVYLKRYTNVSRGDDTYGSSISPDVTFRFGSTYTSNIYVSLGHNNIIVSMHT